MKESESTRTGERDRDLPLITASGLRAGYDGHAVTGELDFTVSAGDYLCVIGENGSGKTTLMRTLLGLQDSVSGSVIFSEGLGRNDIGYLPQKSPVQSDFPASVKEIVLSGFQGKGGLRPFYDKAEKRQAKDIMRRLGIDALEGRCYSDLSGGQQQRVMLARALCAAGKALLLDEPAAGLDPGAAEEMYDTIESLNNGGLTVIMISHDMAAALRYASHILRTGDNVFFGTRDEYLSTGEGRALLPRADAAAVTAAGYTVRGAAAVSAENTWEGGDM